MSPSEPFSEALRGIAAGLRGHPPSHASLNRAAIDIDRLGRHLGGLGLAHAREIGSCFTAAIAALAAAHPLAEEKRSAPVAQAVGHVEAALAYAAGHGTLPDEADADRSS